MAKKKTTKKEQELKETPLFNIGDLSETEAPDQTTEADIEKVAKPKKGKGRPPKTKAEKEAIKIVNIKIHEKQLAILDKYLEETFQRNRTRFIIDAIFEKVEREKQAKKEIF